MSRSRIVQAELAHAFVIAGNPRPADVDELYAASRTTPLDAMCAGLKNSRHVWTGMVDDVPVCMFGAAPFSILGGMASAWMIGSRGLDSLRAQRELLRMSVPVVEYMQDQFPNLLYNFVDERNHAAIRWLRWLGFTFCEPIPYGVDGLPFLPFYRRGAQCASQ